VAPGISGLLSERTSGRCKNKCLAIFGDNRLVGFLEPRLLGAGRGWAARRFGTVGWYLDSYCEFFFGEVALPCGTKDLRVLDQALFSYGNAALPSGAFRPG
jgi:hypothetical protein